MIREPIDVAEQIHRPGALAVALYTYSQILIGMRRYPEASVVALRAREAYRKFADPFGDALTELTLCQIEIERDHFGEAAQYCHDHDATFAAAHREDLISMGLAYQSRLAVVHGDIARADRLIEKAFSLPSGFRSPAEDIELLENRAKVGQAEGNDKAAAADLLRVIAITGENSAAERARAITLLSASAEADRLLAANKLLVAQTERQQVAMSVRRRRRRESQMSSARGAYAAAVYENRAESPHPVLVASYPDTSRRSWLDEAEATDDVASEESRQSWCALLAAKDVITLQAKDQTRSLPSQWTAWLGSHEYQCALAIPLLSGDLADGFILLAFTDSIQIDPVRMEFVKFLAQQAMIAIRLTRLSEMMSRTAMLQRTSLFATARTMTSLSPPPENR